jgi:putative solute:sodium symporter small subunit
VAELTSEQRDRYWKYNVKLAAILLLVWFVVTCVLGAALARQLDGVSFLGFPLGYYVAAQGSLIVYAIEAAIYAKLMNAKDLEYGVREEGS